MELYFDDLPAAERFYREKLGRELSRAEAGRYAPFGRMHPLFASREKVLKAILPAMVQVDADARSNRPPWAVLHDPEGHNVVLVEKERASSAKRYGTKDKRRLS